MHTATVSLPTLSHRRACFRAVCYQCGHIGFEAGYSQCPVCGFVIVLEAGDAVAPARTLPDIFRRGSLDDRVRLPGVSEYRTQPVRVSDAPSVRARRVVRAHRDAGRSMRHADVGAAPAPARATERRTRRLGGRIRAGAIRAARLLSRAPTA